jgi:hypothetical protein
MLNNVANDHRRVVLKVFWCRRQRPHVSFGGRETTPTNASATMRAGEVVAIWRSDIGDWTTTQVVLLIRREHCGLIAWVMMD